MGCCGVLLQHPFYLSQGDRHGITVTGYAKYQLRQCSALNRHFNQIMLFSLSPSQRFIFFLFLGLALTSLISSLVMMNLYQFTFTVETVAKYSIFLGYLVCINTFIAILPWNIDIKVIHEE